MHNPFHRLIGHALILVTLLFAGSVWATGGPPMVTDDPGTPGDGHWEVNFSALSNHAAGETTYQLPLIDVNYGVGDRVQLKFELPWLVQDEKDGDNRSGVGDGLVGVKWRFYDVGENAWQMSAYPQVAFSFLEASSTHNELVGSGTSYLLPFEFARIYEDFDINFELGRWFRSAQQTDSWIAGVVLTHEVRQALELIAELHDEAAVHQAQDELILNFGTRWNMSERYTLLFSAGRDLHNTLGNKNTLLTYLGLQMRY